MPAPLSLIVIRCCCCAASTAPWTRISGGTEAERQASSAFRHRLLNACRRSTSSPSISAKRPCRRMRPPRAAVSPRMSSAARSTSARVSSGTGINGRPREVQEVRHDLAQRFGFVADAQDVWAELLRKTGGIEQPRVAMDGREAVAELVRDAGRHLAEPGEAVLEPQLLLELDDRRQVAEQADGPVRRVVVAPRSGRRSRRDAGATRRAGRRTRPPEDRAPGRETLFDDVGERRGAAEHVPQPASWYRRSAEQLAAGGIQRADAGGRRPRPSARRRCSRRSRPLRRSEASPRGPSSSRSWTRSRSTASRMRRGHERGLCAIPAPRPAARAAAKRRRMANARTAAVAPMTAGQAEQKRWPLRVTRPFGKGGTAQIPGQDASAPTRLAAKAPTARKVPNGSAAFKGRAGTARRAGHAEDRSAERREHQRQQTSASSRETPRPSRASSRRPCPCLPRREPEDSPRQWRTGCRRRRRRRSRRSRCPAGAASKRQRAASAGSVMTFGSSWCSRSMANRTMRTA